MSRSCCYKNAGAKTSRVLRFLMFCSILDAIYKLVQAVDGQAQAFIHTEQELRYLVDDIAIQSLSTDESPAVSFSELDEEAQFGTFESPIIFDPPSLDFGLHPMGMPHLERVVVQNPSRETSLHLLSISGSTLHFHCSFFQEKVIPPGSNTSFDVVFLARQEGPVENTLFIHTSLGSFKYQVMALGVANPYRLQPYLGVRMPLNSSFAPLIHMHNPHSSTLQLTEMYTSGGDLHLELPSGEPETSRQLWELQPFETKVVMRANFVARVERNHTAYIRIKTNSTPHEYLVVPLEVEVSSAPGIYSPTSVLDFGVVRSQDEPRIIPVLLLNSGQKHVQIVNVIVAPVNEALEVKFNPVKVPPDTLHPTLVANLTLYPWRVTQARKQSSGKIVVKAKNNQFKLIIPYQITLLQGSLGFNANSTRFYVGNQVGNTEERMSTLTQRLLNITNNFNITLVVYNGSLPEEAQSYFSLNLNLPVHLPPGTSATLGYVLFHQHNRELLRGEKGMETDLTLYTNISCFTVPLVAFTGRLQIFLPQGRGTLDRESGDRPLPHKLDHPHLAFGTLALEEKRTLLFAAINENPVDVDLKHWGSNVSRSYVELVGVDKGNTTTLATTHNFWHAQLLPKSLRLKPHHYALLRVCITAPPEEGLYYGEAFLETQYEVIKVPFTFRASQGNLLVDDLYFDNAFPGKISSQPLYIRSTFSHPMRVTSLRPIPDDVRFLFEPSKVSSLLQPDTKNLVGKVFFDPRRECQQKCYSGLPTTTPMGSQWLQGVSLSRDVGESDASLYKSLRSRWQTIINSGDRDMNVTFQLDTSEVRGFFLIAHTTLQWPRLSAKCHLRFPITQVGNTTIKEFALENPSSLPVLAQVVSLSDYPDPQRALSILSHRIGAVESIRNSPEVKSWGQKSGPSSGKALDVFTLQDLEQYDMQHENPVPAYRQSLEEYFSVETHKRSIALLLTPGMRVRVRVGFTPPDELSRTSLLLIRNNLTVLDALVLQGQGGKGQIRFGNKDPGTDAVLMFELTEKHLKDCEPSASGHSSHHHYQHQQQQGSQQSSSGSGSTRFLLQPNLTVRRAFLARNTGELPVYIRGFDISGLPCQGYGFRVLDCQGFELKPNASRKIDIAFTPDFTLSRVERTLHLHTSSGQLLPYTLVATLPRSLLLPCSQSLPRPHWESVLYYAVTTMTLLLLLGVLAAAFLEGDRILRTGFYPMATQAPVAFSSQMTSTSNTSGGSATGGPLSEVFLPELDKVFDLKAIGRDTRRSYDRRNESNKSKSRDQQQQTVAHVQPVLAPQISTSRRRKSRQRSQLREETSVLTSPIVSDLRNPVIQQSENLEPEGQERNSVDREANIPATTATEQSTGSSSTSLGSHHWASQATKRAIAGIFTWLLSSLVTSQRTKTSIPENSLSSIHQSKISANSRLEGEVLFNSTEKSIYFEPSVGPSSSTAHQNHNENKVRHRKHNHSHRLGEVSKVTCLVHELHPHHHHHNNNNGIKLNHSHNGRSLNGEELETSSTTTESSNAESDHFDKDLHGCAASGLQDFARHNLGNGDGNTRHSVTPVKNKTSQALATDSHLLNNENQSINKTHLKDSDICNPTSHEADFELSSKSRAHKKIKVDPTKVYGGDILKPSTLELPYKPKPVTLSGVPCTARSLQQQKYLGGSGVVVKLPKRTNPKFKGPHHLTQHSSQQIHQQSHQQAQQSTLHELEHQGNYYQSLWDPPSLFKSHDDSLSEISQQTENFALRISGQNNIISSNSSSSTAVNRPPPPPPPPTNRKASLDAGSAITYSAVVSGESNVNPSTTTSTEGRKMNPPGGERSASAKLSTATLGSKDSFTSGEIPVRPQSLPLDVSLFWPSSEAATTPGVGGQTRKPGSLFSPLDSSVGRDDGDADSISRAILGAQTFAPYQQPLTNVGTQVLLPDTDSGEEFYPSLGHSLPALQQQQQLHSSQANIGSSSFWGPVGAPYTARGMPWNTFDPCIGPGAIGETFTDPERSAGHIWDPAYLRKSEQWGPTTPTATTRQDGGLWNSLWSDTSSTLSPFNSTHSGGPWSSPFCEDRPSPDPLDLIQATIQQQLSPQEILEGTEEDDGLALAARKTLEDVDSDDTLPVTEVASQLGYDPFRSLSSIWSPKASTSTTNNSSKSSALGTLDSSQNPGDSQHTGSSPWSFLLFANNPTEQHGNLGSDNTDKDSVNSA